MGIELAACPGCGRHYQLDVDPPLGEVGSGGPLVVRVRPAPHVCGEPAALAPVVALRPS